MTAIQADWALGDVGREDRPQRRESRFAPARTVARRRRTIRSRADHNQKDGRVGRTPTVVGLRVGDVGHNHLVGTGLGLEFRQRQLVGGVTLGSACLVSCPAVRDC